MQMLNTFACIFSIKGDDESIERHDGNLNDKAEKLWRTA